MDYTTQAQINKTSSPTPATGLLSQLEEIEKRLSDISSRLHGAMDRLVGGKPPPSVSTDVPFPPAAQHAMETMERIHSLLHLCASGVNRLENAL